MEYGIRKNAPDDRRVRTGGALVVGDSFSLGALVGDRETWPAQLEQILGLPVINAAANSYGRASNWIGRSPLCRLCPG
jgi:hypothetical protein